MQMKSSMKENAGFTLVEIAIVLVIIGLLLGGILKGQEMITQARIKNMANDLNGVTAAYFSYQDRYKAVPGDDSQAGTRWAGVTAGDGNGTIAGGYESAVAAGTGIGTTESTHFWWHLRSAGMIAGPALGAGASNQPSNAVGGIVGVQNGAMGLNGPVICTTNVPDKIAIALDTQLDDSRAATGSVRALQVGGNVAIAAGPPGAPVIYAEAGGQQYQICKSL